VSRSTPESFEKRQRERSKQLKRAEKLERRLLRNDEKKRAKAEEDDLPADGEAGDSPRAAGDEPPEDASRPER